jgi:hypothetical protein
MLRIKSVNTSTSSALVLEATHRVPGRSIAVAHVGTAAAVVEAERTGVANRTAPVIAAGTDIDEQSIAGAAAAPRRQFKR